MYFISPVAAEKLAVRTMDNSWCPRSLSIKLSGKENVGLVSQISLPYLFRSKMVYLLKKIDQKFSIAWQPHIHGTKVLFPSAGTPCKDPISELPPSQGKSNWPLSFLDCQTQSTTHRLSSLSRLIFSPTHHSWRFGLQPELFGTWKLAFSHPT